MSTAVQVGPVSISTAQRPIRIAAFALMAGVGLGMFARFDWFLAELALSVSLHSGLALFVAAAILRRFGLARDAGAALLVGLVAVYPWILETRAPRAMALAKVPVDTLVVLAANTYPGNEYVDLLFEAIDSQGAHLVALPEPSPALIRRLAAAGYNVAVDRADGSKFGLAVVAAKDPRLRVKTSTVVWLGGRSPLARVDFEWLGQPAVFFGVHPPAPTSQAQMVIRQRHLAWLTEFARTSSVGVVVAGDFNTALASPAWGRLTERLRRPRGWSPATWPAELGPVGLSIDHVLVTEHWAAGPEVPVTLRDSDHRGVRVALHHR